MFQAKGFILVSGGSGSSEVQHSGLLRHYLESDGLGDSAKEDYPQQLWICKGICLRHEPHLDKLLQIHGDSHDISKCAQELEKNFKEYFTSYGLDKYMNE